MRMLGYVISLSNAVMFACLGVASVGSCYLGSAPGSGGGAPGSGGSGDASSSWLGPGASSQLDASDYGQDLPCDVQALLASKCQMCHGLPPNAGVPMSMVTAADLKAPAPDNETKTVAVVSVERMQDTTDPMPPIGLPPATSDEISALQAWIDAGYPASVGCAPSEAGLNPFATAAVCTSDTYWTEGNNGSGLMHPGGACISCHTSKNGPVLLFGGTVYPTGHEPIDCNGSNVDTSVTVEAGAEGGANAGVPIRVVVTDSDQQVFTMSVNSAGNFFLLSGTSNPPVMPYTVKVVAGSLERDMVASETTGDCNSCHTQAGNISAPGRVLAP